MNSMEIIRAALESLGCNPRREGGGYRALCPSCQMDGAAHDKGLTLHEGNGKALLYCHGSGNCTAAAIVAAAGMDMSDLFERPLKPVGGNGRTAPVEVARWTYTDESGTPLVEVIRLEPGPKGTGKTFTQRLPGATGGGIGNVRRVLYRLPDVLATVAERGTVYLVEGEKCADAINNNPDVPQGTIATTNMGGSGAWKDGYADCLIGANVVVWRDKDEPGGKWANAVCKSLDSREIPRRLVESPTHHDAADHLDAGLPISSVINVSDAWRLKNIDIPSILTTEDDPIPWVIHGLLATNDLAIIAGEPGTGKSVLALDMALALASGGTFLGVHCEPQSVLYIDEEMSKPLAKRRLKLLIRGRKIDPATLKIHYLNGNGVKLDSEAGLAAISDEIERTKAQWVVLDSFIRFHDAEENSNSEMSSILATIRALQTRFNCGFIILHHLSKPGGKDKPKELGHRLRGASDLRAAVDQLYGLEGNPATNIRTMTHEKCRWSECSPQKTMKYTERDGAAVLTAESLYQTAETIILDLIEGSESTGITRQDIISVLKVTFKAPDRTASGTLKSLLMAGKIRKSTTRPTRLWLADFAPQGAIGFDESDTDS